MANLIPIVTPAVDSVGNPITTTPTVLFSQAIEEGSITESNFFLLTLRKEGSESQDELLNTSNAIEDIVVASVSHRKVNLLDNDTFTGNDYGDTLNAGKLYRSEITIFPKYPLRPNINYAGLVSKNVTTRNVFDPKPNLANTGTAGLEAMGVWTGLATDTYTINIVASGTKNDAVYYWQRSSDSYVSPTISARGRFIEIDKGMKIKFLDGSYAVGDQFTIKAKPQDKLLDLFSWDFGTGAGQYQVPNDERSDDLINLPVVNPNAPSLPTSEGFYVKSIEPALSTSLVKIASKAIVSMQGVILQSLEETSDFNGWKFEFISGGTAGSEIVTLTETINSGKISVEIEPDVSSCQQVVDALNASVDINGDFEASTITPTAKVKVSSSRIQKGAKPNTFIITFNKNIDIDSVPDSVRITSQDIYPISLEEDLYFSTTVDNDKMILTIEE